MDAVGLEEVGLTIDAFVMINESHENKTFRAQARLLNSIFSDLKRCPATLEIGNREVILCGNSNLLPEEVAPISVCDPNRKEATVQAIYEAIKTQSELSDEAALAITKQFLLGYRGQSGQVDAQSLVALPLFGATSGLFNAATDSKPGQGTEEALKSSLKNCPPCVMQFTEQSGQWQLRSKTELTPLPGIYKLVRGQKQFITSEYRFVFPDDTAIRENLSITSTLDQSNGQFHWSSPLRDNPPQKVIFYGGCNPAGAN
jgi:hypothetical protein